MTIKSKTFYISDAAAFDIQRGSHTTLFYTSTKDGAYKNEITISWKEDRKAEVTESQIDEIMDDWNRNTGKYLTLRELLKERIFKDPK